MSFVEGMSVVSVEVTDPGTVLCITSVALLVGLLLTIPAVATTLRLFSAKRGLGKLLWHLVSDAGRRATRRPRGS